MASSSRSTEHPRSKTGAVSAILRAQQESKKPLAIVVAGHNGSGKSTFWRYELAPRLRMPLVNADRMMLSILPDEDPLPTWARELRDHDESWMKIAQKGVEAFVAQAMAHAAPFAMETVFSHWLRREDGTFESKIDLIRQMQDAGYFVLLVFVGLMNVELSVARVATRVMNGGHDVAEVKLRGRFARTQRAIGQALDVADAALLTDNSRTEKEAFTVCHVRIAGAEVFDIRDGRSRFSEALAWLGLVAPRPAPDP